VTLSHGTFCEGMLWPGMAAVTDKGGVRESHRDTLEDSTPRRAQSLQIQ
jgi:hypothetical protein